jgi:hypothetical protein
MSTLRPIATTFPDANLRKVNSLTWSIRSICLCVAGDDTVTSSRSFVWMWCGNLLTISILDWRSPASSLIGTELAYVEVLLFLDPADQRRSDSYNRPKWDGHDRLQMELGGHKQLADENWRRRRISVHGHISYQEKCITVSCKHAIWVIPYCTKVDSFLKPLSSCVVLFSSWFDNGNMFVVDDRDDI